MAHESTTLIDVINVSKSFKTEGELVNAVKKANFSIEEGSFTIVYGPSGSGKTTLLNMLIGLDAPTEGSIIYRGSKLSSMKPDERANFRANKIGMVQQASYWVKSLSVVDNVSLPLYFLGNQEADAKDGALRALKRVGMDNHANKYPTVLSGGEQQRVAMARALVNDPPFIIADEPTGNLDKSNGDLIISLLLSLNKKFNRTIVLVTHNIEYLSLGDQLLMMEDGSVTQVKKSDIQKITNSLVSNVKSRLEEWTKHE